MENFRGKASKIIDLLFVLVIVFFLGAGLARTLLFPKDINYLENRPANKVADFSLSGYLDSSFQSSVEDALADQVFFAQRMKDDYNQADSWLLRRMLGSVIQTYRDRYIPYHGEWIFQEEYLLYSPGGMWEGDTRYDGNLASYNAAFAAHPDVEFYLYYVETDLDINLETGKKSNVYDYIKANLAFPAGHVDSLEVDDFKTYSQYFLKTDHHWGYQGSYQGYTEILRMLAPEEAPLQPLETVALGTSSGSKAAAVGIFGFEEDFSAYRFAYPDMTITINGRPAADYGSQESWFARAAQGQPATLEDNLRYSTFYGGDSGEVIFDTGKGTGENLLILGDSYDNAILKLLASHFDRTYSVDQRYYEEENGVPFDLGEYIAAHGITKVLAVGYSVSLRMAEFAWGEG